MRGLSVLIPAGVLGLLVACHEHRAPQIADSPGFADYYVSQRAGVPVAQISADYRVTLEQELKQVRSRAESETRRASPETQYALEQKRLEILVHAAAVRAGVYATPSPADLQSDYEHFVDAYAAKQFHVAHILVPTETAAAEIIGRLQRGEDFGALARTRSADDSKAHDGDLGWKSLDQLPPELATALSGLRPGESSTRPIHTSYGWHVAKVLETRAVSPPTLHDIEPQLIRDRQEKRYREFLATGP